MRVTTYFPNKTEMSAQAEIWANERSDRWFVRTTFRCDHAHHERRQGILLMQGETAIQKLIVCSQCHKYAGKSEVPFLKTEIS